MSCPLPLLAHRDEAHRLSRINFTAAFGVLQKRFSRTTPIIGDAPEASGRRNGASAASGAEVWNG